MSPRAEQIRRIGYSCFIVTNLFVIVYCNLPNSVGSGIAQDLQHTQLYYYNQTNAASARGDSAAYHEAHRKWKAAAAQQYWAAIINWRIRTYAHYVGLNNQWQMFGHQSRFNWWFVIKGSYTNGERVEEVVLDLPRQSAHSGIPRTRWQYHFFDFREGKFHLNMYGDVYARAAYARYLARQYPTYQGLPIDAVVYELHYQNIRSPAEARKAGNHLEPEVHSFIYNRFQAQGELEPVRGVYSLPPLGNGDPPPEHLPEVAPASDEQATTTAPPEA